MQKPKMILVEKVENPRAGTTKQIAESIWDTWRNHREQGNVRKGYRFVKEMSEGEKYDPTVLAKKVAAPKVEFEPPELETGNGQAESAPAQSPDPEPKETQVVEPAAPDGAKASLPPNTKRDNFLAIQGMGNKIQDGLYAAGINTYADLMAVEQAKIDGVLEALGVAPKKAQVPRWKDEAKKLANPLRAGINQ